MQQRPEHEFGTDGNQALLRLSEELSRFSVMIGVVGMALVGLGVTAVAIGGYGYRAGGLASIALGLIAMIGGGLFLRPRATFKRITHTTGRDVTRLMDALDYLDRAHGLFRTLLILFLVARVASFVAARIV
jgi:hypothetical protein